MDICLLMEGVLLPRYFGTVVYVISGLLVVVVTVLAVWLTHRD